MVLEIINAHVHSFSVVASQEEALVLDAQGIAVLKQLLALVRPKPNEDVGKDKTPPSAAEILDHIKAALDKGVEPGSAKYTALAERIRLLPQRRRCQQQADGEIGKAGDDDPEARARDMGQHGSSRTSCASPSLKCRVSWPVVVGEIDQG